jgi:DNA-binding CsgD family transcriptional regulator
MAQGHLTPITLSGYSCGENNGGAASLPGSTIASREWQQVQADMIDSLSFDSFYENFARGCELVSGYQSTMVVWASTAHRPINLYDDLPENYAAESRAPWFEGAYLLDPFYGLFVNNAPDGIYHLADLAPDNFFDSEYYRAYYSRTGLTDEIGLIFNLDQDHCLLISLGNREAAPPKPGQVANLQLVLPVLRSLCRKQQSAGAGEITLSAPLDRAFRNFGRDHLSARECEVIQLILKGHSNKSIAQLLEISVDTVKVYNKRFHTKLEISSQAELFSLFLEAISLVPFDADIDPLTHYREITGG